MGSAAVDRLGRDLLRRLESARSALSEENRNLPAYLEQHDVIRRFRPDGMKVCRWAMGTWEHSSPAR